MPVALVTGAGVRLGRATALELARAGFDLVLHAHGSVDRLAGLGAELAALGRASTTVQADLSDPAGIDAIAAHVRQHHAALDVLVNNAGVFDAVPFAEITRAQYRRTLAINLDAPFFLTQALLPLLQAAPAPCVVNLCDIGGERAVARYAHYGVSKAGLVMLTRQLAVELAPRVRVNGVSPGTVSFPESFTPAEREAHLRRVPAGHEGSPEDVARAVRFLVEGPAYITGQILAVDGGKSARL